MVNSVFEDTNRTDFNPEANTSEFIARIPKYSSLGKAFTISLKGTTLAMKERRTPLILTAH
jgi:hypothetical protein